MLSVKDVHLTLIDFEEFRELSLQKHGIYCKVCLENNPAQRL